MASSVFIHIPNGVGIVEPAIVKNFFFKKAVNIYSALQLYNVETNCYIWVFNMSFLILGTVV